MSLSDLKKNLQFFLSFLKKNSRFLMIIFFVLAVRWIGWDHFAIPSRSMVPNLLVFDHIVVKKFSYGIRIPATKIWLIQILPKRGEVVVFRSVDANYFMIKRLIGLPGDDIRISKNKVWVNEKELFQKSISSDDPSYYQMNSFELDDSLEKYNFLIENQGDKNYRVIYQKTNSRLPSELTFKVPEDHLFVLGDNRDHSQDSRFWGFLPRENLMGEALFIWLSCEKTLFNLPIFCYPWTFRWNRMFSLIL